MFTRVTGTIRGSDGRLYAGALIEAQLVNQMQVSPGLVGNNSYRTESNSYGKFYLDLAPSTLDESKPNNYYVFKVINHTTNYYYKVVPESTDPIDFDELPTFTAPDQRPPFLGVSQPGGSLQINIGNDFSGMYTYLPISANGTDRAFSAPGKIHLVALNGIVQNPTADYTLISSNTIEFLQAPEQNDVVLIQYKL